MGKVSDSNGGYTLSDPSMRAPDVAWISNERLSTVSSLDLKKFAHVCPDFIIELMSESDELADLKEKMNKWVSNGVLLGWLIVPKSKQTYIYRFSESEDPEVLLFSEIFKWRGNSSGIGSEAYRYFLGLLVEKTSQVFKTATPSLGKSLLSQPHFELPQSLQVRQPS